MVYTTEIYFLIAMETGNPRSKPAQLGAGKAFPLGLWMAAFLFCTPMTSSCIFGKSRDKQFLPGVL